MEWIRQIISQVRPPKEAKRSRLLIMKIAIPIAIVEIMSIPFQNAAVMFSIQSGLLIWLLVGVIRYPLSWSEYWRKWWRAEIPWWV